MALEIDRDCAELHNDAIDIKHHDGIEEEDVSGSVPQSWAKFSKNNVEESQCEFIFKFTNFVLNVSLSSGQSRDQAAEVRREQPDQQRCLRHVCSLEQDQQGLHRQVGLPSKNRL